MNLHNDTDAHNALCAAIAARKARDAQHEVTMRELRKANRLLEERRSGRRFLGKVAVIQFAAAGVIALFSRTGAV